MKWMIICRNVVERSQPVDEIDSDEEEQLNSPWWKAKKWALHICVRTFQRYGSPGHVVHKDYKEFSDWYLVTFSRAMLETFLNILKSYCDNVFISPRVLTDIFNYLQIAYVSFLDTCSFLS